ncbi:MAG: replication-relaxation family protein, partial [Pedosphaera parvula]|nr:replication-relaxation family protein [Pedosphaera parvula]
MNPLSDDEILQTVAEYGVLTVQQATELLFTSPQMARRRLRRLEVEGLILRRSGTLVGKRGRPEALIWLGEEGKRRLKTASELSVVASPERPRLIDHQILINEMRLGLKRIEAKYGLHSRFIAATSPAAMDDSGASILRVSLPPDLQSGDQQSFIPDGAFVLTDPRSHRSLLFFLEADMATEALSNGKGTDVRQKILNYRTFLGSKGYKRFESIFQSAFHGFRLLFLCHGLPRRQQLCRLVRELRPSDFSWVADKACLASQGLTACIWSVGGRDEEAPCSILGSLAQKGGGSR